VTAPTDPALEQPAPFRCAAASLARDEPVAGTASTVRAFVAVEDPGPWGVRALVDSRLPQPVKDHLRAVEAQRGVKVLLIRRPGGGSRRTPGVRVLVAHAVEGWLESTLLGSVDDVAGLDLEGLADGRRPGLEPATDPAYLVCTHGRHDACCAERGRPFATALCAAAPDQSWEVSHIGGDRFAANALVLPYGLYYGRLDAERAARFAEDHGNGLLDLDHLRGRSRYAFAVQYAEIALRREIDDRRITPFRLRSVEQQEGVTSAVFHADGRQWRVVVETRRRPAEVLTCGAAAASGAPAHRMVELRRLPPAPEADDVSDA
jgi:hypothetical protein